MSKMAQMKLTAIVLGVLSTVSLALIWVVLLSIDGQAMLKAVQVVLAPAATVVFIGLFLSSCLSAYIAFADS